MSVQGKNKNKCKQQKYQIKSRYQQKQKQQEGQDESLQNERTSRSGQKPKLMYNNQHKSSHNSPKTQKEYTCPSLERNIKKLTQQKIRRIMPTWVNSARTNKSRENHSQNQVVNQNIQTKNNHGHNKNISTLLKLINYKQYRYRNFGIPSGKVSQHQFPQTDPELEQVVTQQLTIREQCEKQKRLFTINNDALQYYTNQYYSSQCLQSINKVNESTSKIKQTIDKKCNQGAITQKNSNGQSKLNNRANNLAKMKAYKPKQLSLSLQLELQQDSSLKKQRQILYSVLKFRQKKDLSKDKNKDKLRLNQLKIREKKSVHPQQDNKQRDIEQPNLISNKKPKNEIAFNNFKIKKIQDNNQSKFQIEEHNTEADQNRPLYSSSNLGSQLQKQSKNNQKSGQTYILKPYQQVFQNGKALAHSHVPKLTSPNTNNANSQLTGGHAVSLNQSQRPNLGLNMNLNSNFNFNHFNANLPQNHKYYSSLDKCRIVTESYDILRSKLINGNNSTSGRASNSLSTSRNPSDNSHIIANGFGNFNKISKKKVGNSDRYIADQFGSIKQLEQTSTLYNTSQQAKNLTPTLTPTPKKSNIHKASHQSQSKSTNAPLPVPSKVDNNLNNNTNGNSSVASTVNTVANFNANLHSNININLNILAQSSALPLPICSTAKNKENYTNLHKSCRDKQKRHHRYRSEGQIQRPGCKQSEQAGTSNFETNQPINSTSTRYKLQQLKQQLNRQHQQLLQQNHRYKELSVADLIEQDESAISQAVIRRFQEYKMVGLNLKFDGEEAAAEILNSNVLPDRKSREVVLREEELKMDSNVGISIKSFGIQKIDTSRQKITKLSYINSIPAINSSIQTESLSPSESIFPKKLVKLKVPQKSRYQINTESSKNIQTSGRDQKRIKNPTNHQQTDSSMGTYKVRRNISERLDKSENIGSVNNTYKIDKMDSQQYRIDRYGVDQFYWHDSANYTDPDINNYDIYADFCSSITDKRNSNKQSQNQMEIQNNLDQDQSRV